MTGIGWKAVGGLLAIGTVGWGAFNVAALVAHEERTETRTYDAAAVRVIDVQNSAGSVTIEGAPGRNEITVTARISDGLRETEERQALVDGRLELRASCPLIGSEWCNVKYTIEAPADVEVRADTDNGRLTVRRVDGPVDLQADNGSVEVADVPGDVTIGADNGSITGSRLASATVMADTDNGSRSSSSSRPRRWRPARTTAALRSCCPTPRTSTTSTSRRTTARCPATSATTRPVPAGSRSRPTTATSPPATGRNPRSEPRQSR
jgi:hypothetical protein